MYGVVGVLLLCVGLLIGKIAYVGARIEPLPRWADDGLNALIVVPLVVTLLVFGAGSLGTWLVGGYWLSESLAGWGAMAAIVAGYFAARGALRGWAHRVLPTQLEVIDGGRPEDPSRPPQQPALKKAA